MHSVHPGSEEVQKKNAQKKHQCNFEGCGASFTNQSELTAHVTEEHTGKKPYLCEECGATFVSKGNLNKHTKKVHSEDRGPRGFPCEVPECGRVFNNAYQLEQHTR